MIYKSKHDYKPILCLLVGVVTILFCACTQQGNVVSNEKALPADETASLEDGSGGSGDMAASPEDKYSVSGEETCLWGEMQRTGAMELSYATQFAVDYYGDDYSLITITEGGRYLVVSAEAPVPDGLDADIVVLKQPLDRIYFVSTSAMDLVRAIGGIGNIRLTGTRQQDWYIDAVAQAMEQGQILYAGKYNAPDYELILSQGCNLAIENTMIYHTPEVKEQLENMGIPVLVERSSYEGHPLGRMEWMKLYGLLTGKTPEAEAYYKEQLAGVSDVFGQENTGKTAAFFYVNNNGAVNVRKPGDYVAEMIALAGGCYVPQTSPQEENALSTMNMQMEAFYAEAKDADVLIYNSTIDAELLSIDELLKKSPLFADFAAVKNGNVWCTGKNMFQESTGIGDMIVELHRIITGAAEDEMTYFHRLK